MNPTIVRLSLRAVLGRRRGILLFVLPGILLALAILVRILAGTADAAVEGIQLALGMAVVVPLVALIATTSVLAPEIDDGSISYLLAKPLSRHTIVVSKLVVAVGCVLVFAAIPMVWSDLILDNGDLRLAIGYGVGALAGGATYCAVFALMSVLTKHAVVWGLVYWLIWEGLLGELLDGVRWLSITWWARAITEAVGGGFGIAEKLGPVYATTAMLLVLVAGTFLAGHKLRAFNLTGDE